MILQKAMKTKTKNIFQGEPKIYSTGIASVTIELKNDNGEIFHLNFSKEEITALQAKMDKMKADMENHYKIKIGGIK